MDDITTKALIIGVSIFVTLLIVTVIIFEYTHIKDIYAHVAEVDITFEERLNEFDKYRDENNIFTGIDFINTVRKYAEDNTVEVCYDSGTEINCESSIIYSLIPESSYNKSYYTIFEEVGTKYKITFKNK